MNGTIVERSKTLSDARRYPLSARAPLAFRIGCYEKNRFTVARSDRNGRNQTEYSAHLYDRLPRASVDDDVLTVDTNRSGTAEKDCDVGDLGGRSDVGIEFGSDGLALFGEDLHGRACNFR